MEQNIKPRNRPTHICSMIFDKGSRAIQWRKIVFSVNSPHITECLYAKKKEHPSLSHTVYKN